MSQVESKGRRIGDKALVDIESWLESITKGRPASEAELIRHACDLAQTAHAGQTRASGEPYFRHSIAVAQILADLRLDHEAISAAILHDVVEDTDVSLEDITQKFGSRVAHLVDGVTKMDLIEELPDRPGASRPIQMKWQTLWGVRFHEDAFAGSYAAYTGRYAVDSKSQAPLETALWRTRREAREFLRRRKRVEKLGDYRGRFWRGAAVVKLSIATLEIR